jgi:tetratricopeptide (TPR) repeat protein
VPPTAQQILLHHNILAAFSGALFLMCQLFMIETADAAVNDTRYAIVLASAPGENLTWEPSKNHLFDDYSFYVEQTSVNGKPWERLCLGFFSPRKDAVSILGKVKEIYPGAWVKQVATRNILTTIHSPTGPGTAGKGTPTHTRPTGTKRKTVSKNTSTLTEEQLDSLMLRAKTDLKNKKYSGSIRYFNAIVASGESEYSQEALELLGLARQRNGQKAHAVSTYEKYLERYPDSEGSDRVSQRLAGLLTASSSPVEKIRMETDIDDNTTTYGSLSQYYQSNTASVGDAGDITNVSQLITYFDVTSEYRTPDYEHHLQLTSNHVYDFVADENDKDSEFRFYDTYYELTHRKTGSSGRIGRQRLQVGGIFSRFDGLSAGYQFTPDMRLNILAGFPVDVDNKTSINEHKNFYGLTFETGTFFDHWNMNLFYFDQKNDGLTDGNSIGTELRYRDNNTAIFGLIDYDLFYDEINLLQVNANRFFDHGRTAFINAYTRKVPLQTTSNALIGRQEKTIDELKKVMNIEQIYQLAKDRTADNTTLTVGGAQPINKKYQASADITFIRTGETIASGGVAATPDTGTNYYVNTQLVANNLLSNKDTTVLGIRYYDTNTFDTTSFIANTRFPITRNWRINPRLQYDIRTLSDGRSQKIIRALFRTDYRYLSKARFDFELGYDDINDEAAGEILASNNLYFTLGYRWDF